MKVLCIVALCACVLVGGKLYCARFSAREKACKSFIAFLNFAKGELRFSALTVMEIVQKFQARNPDALVFLNHCTEPLSQSVQQALCEDKLWSEKQKNIITEFFVSFGSADEASTIGLIEYTLSAFMPEYEMQREDSREKIKLIRRLSLLLAAGIAILLI